MTSNYTKDDDKVNSNMLSELHAERDLKAVNRPDAAVATTGQELWLDEKRVKNKMNFESRSLRSLTLNIEKATNKQDPALPQVDAVVMNDTQDGPPAQHRSMHQAAAADDDDDDDASPFNEHPTIDHSGQPCGCGCGKLLQRGYYITCFWCADKDPAIAWNKVARVLSYVEEIRQMIISTDYIMICMDITRKALGHPGYHRMMQTWKSMMTDIRTYCSNCHYCRARKSSSERGSIRVKGYHISKRPWQRCHIEFMVGLPII